MLRDVIGRVIPLSVDLAQLALFDEHIQHEPRIPAE